MVSRLYVDDKMWKYYDFLTILEIWDGKKIGFIPYKEGKKWDIDRDGSCGQRKLKKGIWLDR